MKLIAVLLILLMQIVTPVRAENPLSDLGGMGNFEIAVRLFILKRARSDSAEEWTKIEAKRKNFVQEGNVQMSKIAKEEADAASRRYYDLDREINAMELQKARNDLKR